MKKRTRPRKHTWGRNVFVSISKIANSFKSNVVDTFQFFNSNRRFLFVVSFVSIALVFLVIFLIELYIDSHWLATKRNTIVDVPSLETEVINNLYITVKNINPTSSTATLDVKLTTNDATLTNKQVQMLIYSGDIVVSEENEITPYLETELHRVQMVLPPAYLIKSIDQTELSFEAKEIEIKITHNQKFFPFDDYWVRLHFIFSANIYIDTINTTAVYFDLVDNEYLYTNPIGVWSFNPNGQLSENKLPNSVQVIVLRPDYIRYQVLSILLLLLALTSWSFIKIVRRSPDQLNILEVLGINIGIILAIPDIRDFLVPDDITYAPVIDGAVGLIIIISLLTMASYIFKVNARSNKSQ